MERNEKRDEDALKEENEYLKMKLMLESGAHFGNLGAELPPEIENQFLQNIAEFEKQSATARKIKVFDKIKRPSQFLPINDIPDEMIDESWQKLADYINEHGVDLTVCSPNVSKRELYRFTVEELFEFEMDDLNIPGMVC
jgi:hypothetical protein